MLGFYVYALVMWLFFSVDGAIEIFGGMGKNFKVCRYTFYLFESYKQYKVCQITLLYTSNILSKVIILAYINSNPSEGVWKTKNYWRVQLEFPVKNPKVRIKFSIFLN